MDNVTPEVPAVTSPVPTAPVEVTSEVISAVSETSVPKEIKPLPDPGKRKKSRRLTAFFSGRDIDFGNLSSPHRTVEVTPEPEPVPTKGQEMTRLFEQNNRIELNFSQTRENQRLQNQYGTKAFTRRYELLLAPCYLAPEELDGRPLNGEDMKRADVFRVGCVIYELFAFQPLFTRLSLQWYKEEGLLNGLEVLPEPVRSLVTVMLDLDPVKRPDMLGLAENSLISYTARNALHVKPSMMPFDSSVSRIYQVYGYYLHTPVSDHNATDMTRLIHTLTSVTTDEIPLILPLLRRILTDIMHSPSLHNLTHTFITLWTRIASSLHEEQVSQLLLPVLLELLEGSLQMKNYDPLMGVCERSVCGKVFGCVGSKQFLKGLLPLLMEQLLSPQTPTEVSECLVSALTLVSSPRFLGPALTTRYILPTVTVKTGNIGFKRTAFMRAFPEDTLFEASLCPTAQTLIHILPYITPEAILSITLAHLLPKAYSLLALLPPSSSTPTLKSTQAAMCVSEITEVIRAIQPFFSPRMLQYNLIQCKSPRLADLLQNLYLPEHTDDSYLIHANLTLLFSLITLFFDLAARLPQQTQEEVLYQDLQSFFAKLYNFYRTHSQSQSLLKALIIRVKERTVFQRQRIDPSLSVYSFQLLELLREPDADFKVIPVENTIASPVDYKSNIAKNLTSRCWAAANNIHMVGGSAGFQNNRSDLDSAVVLKNQVKLTMSAYEGCIYGIVTRGDESVFATVGMDTGAGNSPCVTVWRSDRKPLVPICSFGIHQTHIHSLAFLSSCPLLVSCSDKLVICDYERKTVLSVVDSPRGPFTCMTSSAVSVTGKGVNGTTVWQQIFCGTRTNEIVCYDVRQKFYDARLCGVFPLVPDLRQVAPPTEGLATPVLCAITTLEDQFICAAWTNGVVDILTQRMGTPLVRWQAHTRAVAKLQFISHKYLITACVDGRICVWELQGTKEPLLYAEYTGLSTITNAHTICVTACGSDVGVTAAGGDVLLSNTDLDLREYMNLPENRGKQYPLTPAVVTDGITSAPLSKLRLCVMAVCPLRRIALCGSEDGKLYVIQ